MTDYIFRRAMLSDATELTAVFAAAYAPFKETIADLPDVTAGIADEIASSIVWVAAYDSLLGGLVARVNARTLHIANLAVHPNAGGQGIGRKLMAEAETYAQENGFQKLVLATHPQMPKNIHFYERLGWSVKEKTPRKVMMRKKL